MGLFKKNPDPITDRSKELNARISELESRIKKLTNELQEPSGPRLRSTAYPRGQTAPAPQPVPDPHRAGDPVFEKVDQNPFKGPIESIPAPHANELTPPPPETGGLWDRIKKQFQVAPSPNPKLVNYLAAGSIQGLRPLRYEKRIARNRFLALAGLLLLAFVGIFYALEHRH
jgi:hypothetical protein